MGFLGFPWFSLVFIGFHWFSPVLPGSPRFGSWSPDFPVRLSLVVFFYFLTLCWRFSGPRELFWRYLASFGSGTLEVPDNCGGSAGQGGQHPPRTLLGVGIAPKKKLLIHTPPPPWQAGFTNFLQGEYYLNNLPRVGFEYPVLLVFFCSS